MWSKYVDMFNSVRISRKSIRSGTRRADVVKARKIVCYLFYKKGLDYKKIALLVNLSEEGVGYAIRSLKSEMHVNSKLKNEIYLLELQHVAKNINK